jgi:hypothetical protein
LLRPPVVQGESTELEAQLWQTAIVDFSELAEADFAGYFFEMRWVWPLCAKPKRKSW